jgi:hypothetical protein
MWHPTELSNSPIVLILNDIIKASLTFSIDSGVLIIPQSSTNLMTNEIGLLPSAF